MRKVLYVSRTSVTINNYLVEQIEMLKKQGYRVECACLVEEQIEKKLTAKGLRVFDIPFSTKLFGISNIKAFFRLLDIHRINQYDIIHVHEEVASLYVRLLKFKYPKVKIIYSTSGYAFSNNSNKLSYFINYSIEKLLASVTDIIINTNKEEFEITKTSLRPAKCHLIEGLEGNINSYKDLSSEEINKIQNDLLKLYKSLHEEEFFGQPATLYYTTK